MRRTREIDSSSLVEIVLAHKQLSDFFSETDSFDIIQANIQDSLVQIKGTKKQTEEEKADLEDKKAEQVQLRAIQQLENKKLASAEADKKNFNRHQRGGGKIPKTFGGKTKKRGHHQEPAFLADRFACYSF